MVEGAPLLRAYMLKTRIEGSNPSLSANKKATLAVAFLLAKSGGHLEIPPVRPGSSDSAGAYYSAHQRQAAPQGRVIRLKRVARSRYLLAAFTAK